MSTFIHLPNTLFSLRPLNNLKLFHDANWNVSVWVTYLRHLYILVSLCEYILSPAYSMKGQGMLEIFLRFVCVAVHKCFIGHPLFTRWSSHSKHMILGKPFFFALFSM